MENKLEHHLHTMPSPQTFSLACKWFCGLCLFLMCILPFPQDASNPKLLADLLSLFLCEFIFPHLGFKISYKGHWKPLITAEDSNGVNSVIKAHLSWKLLFHLAKPVYPGDAKKFQDPSN